MRYKPPAKTSPLPPKSGKVVPRCYAGALQDCDGELSREHWISHAVLREVSVEGETFITNAAGLPPEGRWIPAANYAANILCERHNRALSPLDVEGQRFMQMLEEIDQASMNAGTVASEFVFSGHDIERWMLKALCGAMAVGAFQTKRAERLRGDVAMAWLERLFQLPYLPNGWGLSFMHEVGVAFRTDKNVGLAPLLVDPGEVVGITAAFRGLEFALLLRDVPLGRRRGTLTASVGLRLRGRERRSFPRNEAGEYPSP